MAGISQAYVIDAVRTAVGKRNGALAGVHPVDLGALGWRGLLDRNDVDPAAVDDVIAGCVDAIGAQAGNIARLSWLAAGYPEEVPGVTVDRQCGSSQQAISFGAQAIMAGTADLIVAGAAGPVVGPGSIRPCRRTVGGCGHHRVSCQRLLQLPHRGGHLGLQPTPMSDQLAKQALG